MIAADFRFVRAFPVLNDGSDVDRRYHQNAERILLQSVAAATMSAHLAAAALGYAVWWITAIGQDDIQKQVKPLLVGHAEQGLHLLLDVVLPDGGDPPDRVPERGGGQVGGHGGGGHRLEQDALGVLVVPPVDIRGLLLSTGKARTKRKSAAITMRPGAVFTPW